MEMRLTLALLTILVVVALVVRISAARQRRALVRLRERLLQSQPLAAALPVGFAELATLPAPVAHYLRHVLRDGQPRLRVVQLTQHGELRTDLRSRHWLPFQAQQLVTPLTPGFLWDACIQLPALLHLRIRDAYFHGSGSGQISLLSAFTIGSDDARPELNAGALHRYLAEAVWYPTALLPSSALHWDSIGPNKARATLTDSGVTVSLEFWFNEAGEVTGIYAPDRWSTFAGNYRQRPWEGHFRNYQEQDGMLVPKEGEVGWYEAGIWQVVWKGHVDGAYTFAG